MKRNRKLSASERHELIRSGLEANPFMLDEDLARELGVSIHTIRADRKTIGIPEVRKRGRDLSDTMFGKARSLSTGEIVGEVLEIDLDKTGLSLLETTADMGLEKSGIIRGHTLFAQANSLAAAVCNAEMALTAQAQVQFTAAAFAGEKILAKARVLSGGHWKKDVEVILKTPRGVVFQGRFLVYCLNQKMADRLGILPGQS